MFACTEAINYKIVITPILFPLSILAAAVMTIVILYTVASFRIKLKLPCKFEGICSATHQKITHTLSLITHCIFTRSTYLLIVPLT